MPFIWCKMTQVRSYGNGNMYLCRSTKSSGKRDWWLGKDCIDFSRVRIPKEARGKRIRFKLEFLDIIEEVDEMGRRKQKPYRCINCGKEIKNEGFCSKDCMMESESGEDTYY